jgi:hypothetical protein
LRPEDSPISLNSENGSVLGEFLLWGREIFFEIVFEGVEPGGLTLSQSLESSEDLSLSVRTEFPRLRPDDSPISLKPENGSDRGEFLFGDLNFVFEMVFSEESLRFILDTISSSLAEGIRLEKAPLG